MPNQEGGGRFCPSTLRLLQLIKNKEEICYKVVKICEQMWRFKFLSSFDSKMTPLGKSYRLPCQFEKLKLPYFKRPVLPDSQKVKCLMWFYLPPPFFMNLWSAGSQDVQWKMWFFLYIDIKSNVGMIF